METFHLLRYLSRRPDEGSGGSHSFDKHFQRFLRLPVLTIVFVEGFTKLALRPANYARAIVGSLDRVQLPTSILTERPQNLHLARILVNTQPDSIPSIGKLCDNPQQHFLAASANPDLARHWSRVAPGSIDLEVLSLKRRVVLGPHRAYDLDSLPQLLHTNSYRWKRYAVRLVLGLVPARAKGQH